MGNIESQDLEVAQVAGTTVTVLKANEVNTIQDLRDQAYHIGFGELGLLYGTPINSSLVQAAALGYVIGRSQEFGEHYQHEVLEGALSVLRRSMRFRAATSEYDDLMDEGAEWYGTQGLQGN